MGWVKLDDAFFTDQRAMQAGVDGRALYLAGLCHVARNLSDGFIATEALPVIAALAGVQPNVAAHLCELSLWLVVDGGWNVAHYLDYNRSREQVERERADAAERQRRSRERSRGESQGSDGVSSTAPSSPVLSLTDPSPSSSSSNEEAAPQAVDEFIEETLGRFADRQVAVNRPNNPRAYRKTVLRNARSELVGKALEWRAIYDVTPAQLAEALHEGKVPSSWTNCRRAS